MSKNLSFSSLLDTYGEFLSEKQKLVCELYYNDDLSLSEIAENEGITRQGVNDLIKRAEVQLYDLEDKYHYSERFMRLKELGAKINSGDNKDLAKILEIIEQL